MEEIVWWDLQCEEFQISTLKSLLRPHRLSQQNFVSASFYERRIKSFPCRAFYFRRHKRAAHDPRYKLRLSWSFFGIIFLLSEGLVLQLFWTIVVANCLPRIWRSWNLIQSVPQLADASLTASKEETNRFEPFDKLRVCCGVCIVG